MPIPAQQDGSLLEHRHLDLGANMNAPGTWPQTHMRPEFLFQLAPATKQASSGPREVANMPGWELVDSYQPSLLLPRANASQQYGSSTQSNLVGPSRAAKPSNLRSSSGHVSSCRSSRCSRRPRYTSKSGPANHRLTLQDSVLGTSPLQGRRSWGSEGWATHPASSPPPPHRSTYLNRPRP